MTARRGRSSIPGTNADPVFVAALLQPTTEVPTEHPVEVLVTLVGMSVGETVVGRNVECKSLDLLEMAVDEGNTDLRLNRAPLATQHGCVRFVLELGQAAISVEVRRPQIVDIVVQTVFNVLFEPVADHTKDHVSTEDAPGKSLGRGAAHDLAAEVANHD